MKAFDRRPFFVVNFLHASSEWKVVAGVRRATLSLERRPDLGGGPTNRIRRARKTTVT